MIRNGELSMSEVKRIGRKYWWIPALTVIGGVSIALGVAAFLPKRYTSETLVLVDQPTVSPDIVKPVVTEATNTRLASMQEEILSRTRLQPIIEKFGLYPEEREKTHMEDLVLRLRSAITVQPLEPMAGTGSRQQLPGFQIGVTFDSAQTAQKICSEITTMFMEQNARYMDDKSNRTTKFLSEQQAEAKGKLDEQDARLAEFKRRYIGSLPEQERTNLSLLSGMNSQLDAITQALSRAQQDKAFNESLLSSQLASWKLASEGGGNPDTLEQQVANLEDLLATLQSRYTPEHPDVIKTKSQIEELKKQLAVEPKPEDGNVATTQRSKKEPAQILQLRARMRQDDLNFADFTKRQAQIQKQINILEGRLQSSPAVEQQFKELTRDYETAEAFYNELLRKHDTASMAQDLNHEQEGEHFNVLDPPSLPLTPSFPKKLKFAGGGFGAGLALGLGILFLLAALNKAMHTELDVEICLKLPVLVAVPTLDRAGKGHGGRASVDKTLELAGTRS